MTHECPIDGCQVTVPDYLLMCRPNWAMVPSVLGGAVYATWKDGKGAGTEAHRDACRAAVDHVNDKLAEGAT